MRSYAAHERRSSSSPRASRVYPPRGGGQARSSASTARCAARASMSRSSRWSRSGARRRRVELAPGLREVRVPTTRRARPGGLRLQRRAGVPVRDLGLALHADLTPAYGEALADGRRDGRGRRGAAIRSRSPRSPPRDAAADLRGAQRRGGPEGGDARAAPTAARAARRRARESRRACCADRRAHVVCAARGRGAARRALRAAAPSARSSCPTAPTRPRSRSPPLDARAQRRRTLGLRRRAARAVRRLLARAEPRRDARRARRRRGAPDVRFLVVGSAGLAFAEERMPRQRRPLRRRRRRLPAQRARRRRRRAEPDALGLGDEPEDARLRARRRAARLVARSARAGSASSRRATTRRSRPRSWRPALAALRGAPRRRGRASARAPPPSACASASPGTRSPRAGTRIRRLRALLEGAAVA